MLDFRGPQILDFEALAGCRIAAAILPVAHSAFCAEDGLPRGALRTRSPIRPWDSNYDCQDEKCERPYNDSLRGSELLIHDNTAFHFKILLTGRNRDRRSESAAPMWRKKD
jgi:hypothetical protein